MLKVLSTKILDQNLIDAAHSKEIILTCLQFITTQNLDFKMPGAKFDAIVFTSSNAVKSFFENKNIFKLPLEDLGIQIFSLSGKTKTELSKHHIEPQAIADNAEKLADVILSSGNLKSVLHICGNLKLDTLDHKLNNGKIKYNTLITYETKLTGIIINEGYDAVMFYSPSGVDSFTLLNKLDRNTLYCCIGETTADRLRKTDSSMNVIISPEPTPESMLSTIQNLKITY